MGQVHCLEDVRRPANFRHSTFFDRTELKLLLSLYSSRVISGEWRDYAIDQQAGLAVFSIYRHSYAQPLFTIAKRAGSPGRASEYLVCRGLEKVARTPCLADALAALRHRLQVVS